MKEKAAYRDTPASNKLNDWFMLFFFSLLETVKLYFSTNYQTTNHQVLIE